MNGSYAELDSECTDGGDAIHVNNGQSSPETASYAEFYDGMYVIGGDAPGGVGGKNNDCSSTQLQTLGIPLGISFET